MKKVMLVLVKDMGDVMCANSLAQDIKDYHGEDTEITLFVNRVWAELVQHNKNFKTLLCKENWLNDWDYILDAATSGDFDIVMMPQQIRQEDGVWHQMDYLRHNHLLNYYQLRCVLPVRKTPLVFRPNPKTEEHNDVVRYVVVHCQTRNPDKDFKDFVPLSNEFRNSGYEVFQIGGKGDSQIVDDDHRFHGTFSEIWHLIKNATAYVGLDSGLSYLASTTGTLGFQLCGCTIPKTSGGYGKNFYHIVSEPCPTCRPIRCHAHCRSEVNCISRLKVDKVWNFIDKRLKTITI